MKTKLKEEQTDLKYLEITQTFFQK